MRERTVERTDSVRERTVERVNSVRELTVERTDSVRERTVGRTDTAVTATRPVKRPRRQISLAGAVTSSISVATKINTCLCRQARVCRDKHLVVSTSTCLSRHHTSFVATKVSLSRQNLDKSFVPTIFLFYFCRDEHNVVATKVLSRQAYFCRDNRRVVSRQK